MFILIDCYQDNFFMPIKGPSCDFLYHKMSIPLFLLQKAAPQWYSLNLCVAQCKNSHVEPLKMFEDFEMIFWFRGEFTKLDL
jgi:hypothetical protein